VFAEKKAKKMQEGNDGAEWKTVRKTSGKEKKEESVKGGEIKEPPRHAAICATA
jgi:hypothetical protein